MPGVVSARATQARKYVDSSVSGGGPMQRSRQRASGHVTRSVRPTAPASTAPRRIQAVTGLPAQGARRPERQASGERSRRALRAGAPPEDVPDEEGAERLDELRGLRGATHRLDQVRERM